jgi:4-hydroxy-tetrahydrodipicolinate reductase
MGETTRIGILGAAGRMGRLLVRLVSETPGLELAGGSDRAGAADLDRDLGEIAGVGGLGLPLLDDAKPLFGEADVLVDFTQPEASVRHAGLAAESGRALVIGTTGHDPRQLQAIAAATERAPILQAANMSLGVNLLLILVEQVAAKLDPAYDIEILEMHHRMKVDAPSGTALALGRAAAAGRGRPLEELWVKSRDGITGKRDSGTIGFATLRGGDVVGDHSVIFAGPGERLELTHKAQSRELFAQGALHAARWLAGKPPGRYSIRDVLGL